MASLRRLVATLLAWLSSAADDCGLKTGEMGPCVTDQQFYQTKIRLLNDLGYPWGTAALLAEYDCVFDARYYLFDNTKSMSEEGGFVLGPLVTGELTKGTKFQELQDYFKRASKDASVMQHIVTVDPPEILASVGTVEKAAQTACKIDGMTPHGEKTFGKGFMKIQQSALVDHKDQNLLIVLVTDGVSTDKDIIKYHLRSIGAETKYQMVIKLIAPAEESRQFYDELDTNVGEHLDVLDTLENEAKQVKRCQNDFFSYSPHIHFARTRGSGMRLLDKLDEKRLSNDEAMKLVEYLVKESGGDLAKPIDRDPRKFCQEVERRITSFENVFDGHTMQLQPPVNITRLKEFFFVK
eukprot:TRINITY_DN75225_c0_g1_i1.p1 TRINITY_DN75225_c0_g1~~TRINITY_DN75225_c0_g1_i1.p1  ORF type:complete len:368 (+),score=65.06 TRINITY_DN75225_c0_g1_i1:49-1104(+)